MLIYPSLLNPDPFGDPLERVVMAEVSLVVPVHALDSILKHSLLTISSYFIGSPKWLSPYHFLLLILMKHLKVTI